MSSIQWIKKEKVLKVTIVGILMEKMVVHGVSYHFMIPFRNDGIEEFIGIT